MHTDQNDNLQVSLSGSNATVVKTRSLSAPAGSFQTLATFYSKNGVKTVTAGLSADASHSLSFYGSDRDETGASGTFFGYNGGSTTASTTQTPSQISVSVHTQSFIVTYHNADTVAHTINADCIGWPN